MPRTGAYFVSVASTYRQTRRRIVDGAGTSSVCRLDSRHGGTLLGLSHRGAPLIMPGPNGSAGGGSASLVGPVPSSDFGVGPCGSYGGGYPRRGVFGSVGCARLKQSSRGGVAVGMVPSGRASFGSPFHPAAALVAGPRTGSSGGVVGGGALRSSSIGRRGDHMVECRCLVAVSGRTGRQGLHPYIPPASAASAFRTSRTCSGLG